MKKVISLLVALFVLVACAVAAAEPQTIDLETMSQDELRGLYSQIGVLLVSDSAGGKTIQSFADALSAAGIAFEQEECAFSLVGAIDGAKFRIDGEVVEVYQFDVQGSEYQKAVEDGALNLEAFGMTLPCVFNGELALLVDDNAAYNEVLGIFSEF